MISKLTSTLAIAALCLTLTGCSWIYRPVVQQGNIICQDSVNKLRLGMTADQVLYLMGTPMLTNTFEPNRWDYVYTYKAASAPRQQRSVTLYLINGVVSSIQVSPLQVAAY